MKRVFDQMHMNEITIGYGMTETSPVSTQTGVDDPMEKRVSTVGKVHPHVQLKVIDEQGRTVPRGESGELCTRGYNVMLGYWGDEEKTTEAIDQAGWMHTGDLGTIDDEGYCNIVGRVKDMIIRGGENIYPREIEEFRSGIRKFRMSVYLACPTRSTAKRYAPGSNYVTAKNAVLRKLLHSAKTRLRTTKSRATSASSMRFR